MKRVMLLAGAAVLAMSVNAKADGDAAAGEKLFRQCQACHMVGEDAKNRVGPTLNGIVGSVWGPIEGYKYSKGLLEGREEGRVWDEETLHAYLTKPRDVIPKGRMAFRGIRKEEDRNDVIAYLAQFNEDGTIK